jgi:hypothetical protein
MSFWKRWMVSLSILAGLGSVTGALVASANAAPTAGPEVIHSTQYEVGSGLAVGPWTGKGPISSNRGNITGIPSARRDPPNSGRVLLIDPVGSITVLTTGGNFFPGRTNPFTCAFTATVRDIRATVVSGTGFYRHTTGGFVVTVNINGFQPRFLNGRCNFSGNGPSAFETDNAVAVGFIDLH